MIWIVLLLLVFFVLGPIVAWFVVRSGSEARVPTPQPEPEWPEEFKKSRLYLLLHEEKNRRVS